MIIENIFFSSSADWPKYTLLIEKNTKGENPMPKPKSTLTILHNAAISMIIENHIDPDRRDEFIDYLNSCQPNFKYKSGEFPDLNMPIMEALRIAIPLFYKRHEFYFALALIRVPPELVDEANKTSYRITYQPENRQQRQWR